MTDDRIIEVLVEALIDCNVDKRAIRDALWMLRRAGFEVVELTEKGQQG